MGLEWMTGGGSGGTDLDLKMDLKLLTSDRRRVGAEDGDDKADGIGDKVSGDLNVLGGDRVLDLVCLVKGFTNLVRCSGD